MGTLKWAVYQPEDINWGARSRVEAWSRHDRDIETQVPKNPSTHTGTALAFSLGMIVIFVITWWKFM